MTVPWFPLVAATMTAGEVGPWLASLLLFADVALMCRVYLKGVGT